MAPAQRCSPGCRAPPVPRLPFAPKSAALLSLPNTRWSRGTFSVWFRRNEHYLRLPMWQERRRSFIRRLLACLRKCRLSWRCHISVNNDGACQALGLKLYKRALPGSAAVNYLNWTNMLLFPADILFCGERGCWRAGINFFGQYGEALQFQIVLCIWLYRLSIGSGFDHALWSYGWNNSRELVIGSIEESTKLSFGAFPSSIHY